MKKRLLIIDEDAGFANRLQEQLRHSQWVEICGHVMQVDQAWQMLQSMRPDMVLLGEITGAERGVLSQQFRLAHPHLSFIAACTPQDLVWEPFFRNLGIWVIVKPVVPEQIEALAMVPLAVTGELRSMKQDGLVPSPDMPTIHPPSPPVVPFPSRSQQIEAAIPTNPNPLPKRLITVYGPKGGVGKTFISRELAIYFSLQKREERQLRVLAVDFNLDLGTFATTLNLARTPNLYTWIQDIDSQLHSYVQRQGKNPYDMTSDEWQAYASTYRISPHEIEKYIVTHVETGLHVLTSPRDIRHSFEIRNYHLYLILETLKQSSYDVILIDTAPDTTDATIQALFFAEQVVMVGNPVVDSIENIQRLLKLLREAEYPEERIQVCMNRLQRKEMFTLEEIRAYFQLHPSKKIFPIPDDAEVKKSINTGTPVMLHPGRTAAKDAIESLGEALLPVVQEEKVQAAKGKTKPRPSLLRWLWS